MLRRLERAAFAATRALAAAGLMVLIVFAIMTLADGLLRRLADAPIEIVGDLGGLVVAVAVTCCFPLAYLQRSNITIKFVEAFIGRRAGLLCDALAAVLVAVVALLIAWEFFLYAGAEAHAGDTTVMLEIKTAPFWYVMAIAMACAALTQSLVAVLAIARCITGAAESGVAHET